jgi:hypothetical protein
MLEHDRVASPGAPMGKYLIYSSEAWVFAARPLGPLGGHALRCFQYFDAATLADVSERVGPSEAKIHEQPVPANPDLASV